MPTELRRIVFSHDELRQALDAYLLSVGRPLPVGFIQGARFDGDQNQLQLTIFDRRHGETHAATLGTAEVAVALIRYCFANRIPIPKDARKSLALAGENVTLDVRKLPGGEMSAAAS